MKNKGTWLHAGTAVRPFLLLLLCITALFSLTCCTSNRKTTVTDTQGDMTGVDASQLTYNGEIEINTPSADGTVTYEGGGALVDASNIADGYLMLRHEGSDKRLKVRIIKGDFGYNYDLNGDGDFEVYPLQMGNGAYEIRVLENVADTTYRTIFKLDLEVEMPDQNRVFVFPNQYVWYTEGDQAIRLSYALCQDAADDREKMTRIFDYITTHIQYDKEKAIDPPAGYLPDVDQTLASGKGICFDYTALMAAMLRAQDIPTRLVIGNVVPENILHAWNQVLIDGKWVWMDPTFANQGHSESDYTMQREY